MPRPMGATKPAGSAQTEPAAGSKGGAGTRAYSTVSSATMPACLWPGTEQMISNVPL